MAPDIKQLIDAVGEHVAAELLASMQEVEAAEQRNDRLTVIEIDPNQPVTPAKIDEVATLFKP